MSGTGQSVVRMANQIARNFAVHGDAKAVEATADHIRLFWDPRMLGSAFEMLDAPDCGFSPQARDAIAILAREAGSHAG